MHQCVRPSFQLLFHDSQAAALSLAHNAAQAEAEEAAKLKAKRSAEQKAETRQQTGSIGGHYFPVVGDGHQPHIRGLYTHCKDSL